MDQNPHEAAGTKDDHHGGVGHLVPYKYLVATGGALLVLTVVTVVVADFDFGAANIFIALAIASLKASLVVLFFMHLRWDRPFNGFVLVASIAFVALFISMAMTDTFEYRNSVEEYRQSVLSAYEQEITRNPEPKLIKDRLREVQQQAATAEPPVGAPSDASH